MNLSDAYRTLQSGSHGSSGRGMSYWEGAALCGRRANLQEIHREQLVQIRSTEAAEQDGDDPLDIGTAYHLLQELALRGQFDNEVWDQTDDAMSGNFLEAVRLYRAYTRNWGSALQKWGAELVGVEVLIPSTEAGKAAALALMGSADTGRLDALIRVTDPEGVFARTGLQLPGPGVYLLDHKTGGKVSEKDMWKFTFGNQSINYVYLYNLDNPTEPCQGIIFDKVIRHVNIVKEPVFTKTGTLKQNKSYHHYIAQVLPDDELIIKNLIEQGRENVRLDRANPAQCFEGFKPCWAFTLGLCDRK